MGRSSQRSPRSSSRAVAMVFVWVASASLWVFGALAADEEAVLWPKVFREATDVEVVNLDVFVRTADGRPIADLGVDDFAVEIDGQPIAISNFYAVEMGELPMDAVDPDDDSMAGDQAVNAAEVELQRRLLILYIDNANLTTSGRGRVFEILRQYLLDSWSPDLDVLVATSGLAVNDTALHVMQGMTSIPHEVFVALESLQDAAPGGQRFVVEERQLRQEIEEMNVDAAAGFMEVKGDVEQDRGVAIQAATRQAQALLPRLKDHAQQRHVHVLQSLQVLRQLIDLATGVPRRTSILHVSDRLELRPGEGLLELYGQQVENIGAISNNLSIGMETARFDATGEFLELVRLANAGGLTLYGINASPSAALERGGAASARNIVSPRIAGLVERGRRESQQVLAEGTGGTASRSASDVSAVLASVLDDFNNFYSLGFQLPAGFDASAKVEVQVKRSDLGKITVRSRRTLARRGQDEILGQRTLAALLLDSLEDPLGIRLEALPAEVSEDGHLRVPLRLDIPLGGLVLVPDGAEHQAAVSVYVAARDDRGRTSKVLHHQCPIRIPNKELLMALGRSAVCGLQLEMRPRRQSVAVVVHDANAARTSTLRLDLDLSRPLASDAEGEVENLR